MAQELQRKQLDFLKPYTLGQICHIVELGIKKKYLAYEHNMLLPAAASVSLTNGKKKYLVYEHYRFLPAAASVSLTNGER
jgi:hypothetical protein